MTEHEHQKKIFQIAKDYIKTFPALGLLYAIPNAGKRSLRGGSYMVAEGLKKGVPDICLPIANKSHHGLYIELKSEKGKPTSDQLLWIKKLSYFGNYACVCYGYKDAWRTIIYYLEDKI